jgi:hypothetical protein
MLDRLLEARLNEKVKSRSEERDFIRRYFGPANQGCRVWLRANLRLALTENRPYLSFVKELWLGKG